MLEPTNQYVDHEANVRLIRIGRAGLEGAPFRRYVARLTSHLQAAVRGSRFDVVHLHHATFGATPALLSVFSSLPSLLFIHGTDVLAADASRTQRAQFIASTRAADAIVAPSEAMVSEVLRIAGRTIGHKIDLLPWGVPTDAYAPHLSLRPNRAVGPISLLYAGRISDEKGLDLVVDAVASLPNVRLSATGTRGEIDNLLGATARDVRSLGWQGRRELWALFNQFDALVVPSRSVEAFSLVAVEAQARGLPVLYQPVSGLLNTMGSSGIPLDFTSRNAVTRFFARSGAEIRVELSLGRESGILNAKRYELSSMSARVENLGRRLTSKR